LPSELKEELNQKLTNKNIYQELKDMLLNIKKMNKILSNKEDKPELPENYSLLQNQD
jgi:uncharacterized protein (UPF0335 family)